MRKFTAFIGVEALHLDRMSHAAWFENVLLDIFIERMAALKGSTEEEQFAGEPAQ